MQDEVKQSSDKNNALVLVVTLFVVYCLAPGPLFCGLAFLDRRMNLDLEPVVEVVFFPHMVIYDYSTAYESYLDWWVGLGSTL